MTLARIGERALRQPLAAPVERRHREAAGAAGRVTTSKYFSMNSVRPWNTQTVPLRPAGGGKRAKRNSRPSEVLMVPSRPPRAPDWRGWKRGSWGASRRGGRRRPPYSRRHAGSMIQGFADPLDAAKAPSQIFVSAGPDRDAHHVGSGPVGRTLHVASQEDMSCELSILLPSIVPPSVSTGCFPCSTRSAASTARPDLSALQHRADRRERLPHHGRGRRLHRERPVARGQGEHADDPRRQAGQTRREDRRGALPGHRGAARSSAASSLPTTSRLRGASLENGLLHVDLVREIPEAMKPRQIPIGTAARPR